MGKAKPIVHQTALSRSPGTTPRDKFVPVQVHEAILDDLVYPTEIVGKRVRYKVEGSKMLKVRWHVSVPIWHDLYIPAPHIDLLNE